MIDLVTTIKTAAEAKGWDFILVDKNSYNYEFGKLDMTNGKKVLAMSKFAPTPSWAGGYYTGVASMSPRLFLGRKFEKQTVANVGETYQQKYDARLKELVNDLYFFIVELNCIDNLKEISGTNIDIVENFLSVSIDGAETPITFVFEAQYE